MYSGRVAMISYHHVKANKKYMFDFISLTRTSHISCIITSTILYGAAMSQPMPRGNFEWLSEQETDIDWLSLNSGGPQGYFLEVDLYLPSCYSTRCPITRGNTLHWVLCTFQSFVDRTLGERRKTFPFHTLSGVERQNKPCHPLWNIKAFKLPQIDEVMTISKEKWMAPFIDLFKDFSKDLFNLLWNYKILKMGWNHDERGQTGTIQFKNKFQ